MTVNATSSSQLSMIQASAASNDQAPELNSDIMGVLFSTCISLCDLRTIKALPCINKYWSQLTVTFFKENLKYVCPELTIMDAKTQQRECFDEPKIDEFKIFKAVKKLAPHVEGNVGVTLLTMIKGDTLNKLIEIAAQERMQATIIDVAIIQEFGNVPVEQTHAILITNNVFKDSRNKAYKAQEILAKEHGCQMPTGQEYVALCVLTKKIFQKCLYGHNPPTYGRSSSHVKSIPLAVGACFPRKLFVAADDRNGMEPDFGECLFYVAADGYVGGDTGAGGTWKF